MMDRTKLIKAQHMRLLCFKHVEHWRHRGPPLRDLEKRTYKNFMMISPKGIKKYVKMIESYCAALPGSAWYKQEIWDEIDQRKSHEYSRTSMPLRRLPKEDRDLILGKWLLKQREVNSLAKVLDKGKLNQTKNRRALYKAYHRFLR